MSNHSKSRSLVAFVISGSVHVAFAVSLLAIPSVVRQRYDIVDMTVRDTVKKKEVAPEPEPEAEEEPEPEVEPEEKVEKKVKKPKVEAQKEEEPPPPPPPAEEPPPQDVKEEAPPVFDLGDNTFAIGEGQGGSWSLKRSEGNTRFAGVAKKEQPSVRHTKPIVDKAGKPGGTGTRSVDKPVPLKDLSRRPMPKNGSVPPAPYPPEAKKAGIEGPVVLKVYIDKSGKVRKTQVMQSPDAILAEAAQSAMGNVLWTPPLDKGGNPVDTVIVFRYRFVLDG